MSLFNKRAGLTGGSSKAGKGKAEDEPEECDFSKQRGLKVDLINRTTAEWGMGRLLRQPEDQI